MIEDGQTMIVKKTPVSIYEDYIRASLGRYSDVEGKGLAPRVVCLHLLCRT